MERAGALGLDGDDTGVGSCGDPADEAAAPGRDDDHVSVRGVFLELEGPKTLIDIVATRLGYKPTDFIVKSYLALYQDHLKTRGLPLKDMIFDAP